MFIPIPNHENPANFKANPRSSLMNNTFKSGFPSQFNQKPLNDQSFELNQFSFLNALPENEYRLRPRTFMDIEKPAKPEFVAEYERNIRENIKKQNDTLEILMLKKQMLDKTIERVKEDIDVDIGRLNKFITENEPLEQMMHEMGNRIEKRSWEGFRMIQPNYNYLDDLNKKKFLCLKSEQSSCEINQNIFNSERNSVKQLKKSKIAYKPKGKFRNTESNSKKGMSLDKRDSICSFKEEKKEAEESKNEEDVASVEKYVLSEGEPHHLAHFPMMEKYEQKGRSQVNPDNSLTTLLAILKNMMYSEPVDQSVLDSLNEVEHEILKAFLVKKKIISVGDEMVMNGDFFNSYYKIKTERRREENLKHIFMMAIKFLKAQFRREFSCYRIPPAKAGRHRKEQMELAFYIHYFGAIAESRGWSITRFYQPKVTGSRRREKCQRMKSINQEFVSYIKLGLQFMEDFEKYLNDSFEVNGRMCGVWSDSKDMIEDKLTSKVNKWDETIQEERNGLKKVISSLTGNIRCKMPWCRSEILLAISDVKRLFFS